jgi:hypothetical protein
MRNAGSVGRLVACAATFALAAGSARADESTAAAAQALFDDAKALISTIVPILTYASAWSLDHSYEASNGTSGPLYNPYASAKTTAYATLAIPITLAAATAGLTIWYFAGTKEVDVSTVTAGVVPAKGGAAAVVEGRF